MRILFCLALLCLLRPHASDAQVNQTANKSEILNNGGVIALVKAGFSESVILAKIRSSQTSFDMSVSGMTNLKRAGVPARIISEMLQASNTPAPPASRLNEAPPSAGDLESIKRTLAIHPLRSFVAPSFYLVSLDQQNKLAFLPLHREHDITNEEGKSVFAKNSDCEERSTFSVLKEMAKDKKASVTCHYYRDLAQPSALVQTKEQQPVFLVDMGNSGDPRNMGLLSCLVAGGMRRAVTHASDGKSLKDQLKPSISLGAPKESQKSYLNDIDPAAQAGYTLTQLGNNIYAIVLKQQLQQGEYTFEYEDSRNIDGDEFFGFGIH